MPDPTSSKREGAIGVAAGFAETAAAAVAAIGGVGLGDLDMGFWQLVEEARGDGRLPHAVDAAIAGEPDVEVLLGAGETDIGEAPFIPILPTTLSRAALVEGALVAGRGLPPQPGQERAGLGISAPWRMQRHDGRRRPSRRSARCPLTERHMLEEGDAAKFVILHGADPAP